jgi:hypothetical protein
MGRKYAPALLLMVKGKGEGCERKLHKMMSRGPRFLNAEGNCTFHFLDPLFNVGMSQIWEGKGPIGKDAGQSHLQL